MWDTSMALLSMKFPLIARIFNKTSSWPVYVFSNTTCLAITEIFTQKHENTSNGKKIFDLSKIILVDRAGNVT
jgi:hypothetical protein